MSAMSQQSPAPQAPPSAPSDPGLSGSRAASANRAGSRGGLSEVIVAAVTVLVIVLMLHADRLGVGYRTLGRLATSQCHRFAKQELKSPDSAHFSNEGVVSGPRTFTVAGDVSADNSFGASVRKAYSCTVTTDSTGAHWTLVDLGGLTN